MKYRYRSILLAFFLAAVLPIGSHGQSQWPADKVLLNPTVGGDSEVQSAIERLDVGGLVTTVAELESCFDAGAGDDRPVRVCTLTAESEWDLASLGKITLTLRDAPDIQYIVDFNGSTLSWSGAGTDDDLITIEVGGENDFTPFTTEGSRVELRNLSLSDMGSGTGTTAIRIKHTDATQSNDRTVLHLENVKCGALPTTVDGGDPAEFDDVDDRCLAGNITHAGAGPFITLVNTWFKAKGQIVKLEGTGFTGATLLLDKAQIYGMDDFDLVSELNNCIYIENAMLEIEQATFDICPHGIDLIGASIRAKNVSLGEMSFDDEAGTISGLIDQSDCSGLCVFEVDANITSNRKNWTGSLNALYAIDGYFRWSGAIGSVRIEVTTPVDLTCDGVLDPINNTGVGGGTWLGSDGTATFHSFFFRYTPQVESGVVCQTEDLYSVAILQDWVDGGTFGELWDQDGLLYIKSGLVGVDPPLAQASVPPIGSRFVNSFVHEAVAGVMNIPPWILEETFGGGGASTITNATTDIDSMFWTLNLTCNAGTGSGVERSYDWVTHCCESTRLLRFDASAMFSSIIEAGFVGLCEAGAECGSSASTSDRVGLVIANPGTFGVAGVVRNSTGAEQTSFINTNSAMNNYGFECDDTECRFFRGTDLIGTILVSGGKVPTTTDLQPTFYYRQGAYGGGAEVMNVSGFSLEQK